MPTDRSDLPPFHQHRSATHQHAVQFYESDNYLSAEVARYLAHGFRNGNAMVVIALPEHRTAFKKHLDSQGFDVDATIRSGQFKEFDAHETLRAFMDSELPNRERFRTVIGQVIDECRNRYQPAPVLAYGEMVDILWRDGKHEAAIRLEELWNELAEDRHFDLFCAYALNGFYKGDHHPQFERICRTHSLVYPTERYMELGEQERLVRISVLEQQSFALQAEIQVRKEAEKALLEALDEKRHTEEKLRQTESELRGVLQTAAEGIHWVDAGGRILWANAAELAMMGYRADEYIGHDIREFHLDADVIANIFDQLVKGETLLNYSARLRAKDGSIRHVLINSNAFLQNGQFLHTQCFTRDITELHYAQDAQGFLSAVVASADDAIISKTLDGIITSWNPGAQRIFGYYAEEVIGKPVAILIPPDRDNEEPDILARLKKGERIDHYETKRLRKDGTILDISLSVSPVRNRRGQIIGASKIARDITYRKRLEVERVKLLEQERAARSQAEAANRIKDEFLAILSHELRTPLNAIMGWISILESRQDVDLVERAIDVIKRNAGAQKRMIEDLLDVARILTGKMVIDTDPIDFRSVVNAAVDSVSPAASAKTIRMDTDFQMPIPIITGDADRLQQVVWNLLSNAIKFTPEGGYIQLRLGQTNSHLEFSVRDSGQGIAPQFLGRVFDRFAQGDSSTTRVHGGLGIGLAVVRHLVEVHGGSVHAESPGEGLGATFTVRLPVATAAE
ncbi:MAG TPA: PAS domain S-box protein [Terriglobia bacterium]|jgi:PAS domain S-box-containing protein